MIQFESLMSIDVKVDATLLWKFEEVYGSHFEEVYAQDGERYGCQSEEVYLEVASSLNIFVQGYIMHI